MKHFTLEIQCLKSFILLSSPSTQIEHQAEVQCKENVDQCNDDGKTGTLCQAENDKYCECMERRFSRNCADGVVLWNFGYPQATPLLDVIAAILLSVLSLVLKKYIK